MRLLSFLQINTKQLLILIVVILFPLSLKSQPKLHGEILVSAGGSVDFIFNNYNQYTLALTGRTLTQKTTLYIKKKDTQPYWKLNIFALSDNFENETFLIPIGDLELTIEATPDANSDIDGTGTTNITPTLLPQVAASGHWIGPASESIITITITYTITGDYRPMEIGAYFNQLKFELLTHTAAW